MAIQDSRSQIKNADSRSEKTTGSVGYGYREVPGLDGERLDVIEQLRANLAHLEDLHGRLRFVMNEVRTLIAR